MYCEIYNGFDKVFNDIEDYYEKQDMINDKDDLVQNAIDEALHFISEKYGVIFYMNGFCWDYEK